MEPLVVMASKKQDWEEPVDADDDEYEVGAATFKLSNHLTPSGNATQPLHDISRLSLKSLSVVNVRQTDSSVSSVPYRVGYLFL